MPKELLEQQTGSNPDEIMTDIVNTNYINFGLYSLPGLQYSLRLVDTGGAVFWQVDKSVNNGVLD